MRAVLTLFGLIAALSSAAIAQERDEIGVGRLFTNDYLGDGQDRWRTGSYVYSNIRAPRRYESDDAFGFGELLEYRLRAEIISADGTTATPGDRPYVGALSLGLHTHFDYGAALVSLGVDVTAIGPQTGLSRFQEAFHDRLGMPEPAYTDLQLGDAFHVSGTAAIVRPIPLDDNITLRPFAEVQVGVEDTLRVGGDVMIGAVGQDDLLLRDVTTGQLYRGTDHSASGFSYVFGADVAAVGSSDYLPETRGVAAADTRTRARAGVHYQHREGVSFFYGMTYLSPEIIDQSEGQVVGSVKLNFNF